MAQATQAIWRTALVTGASVGIGQEMARILASRGTNLILVARNKAQLEEQAASYRSSFGVKVEVLAADLADPDQLLAVENRARALSEPVDLLVNNAGVGYPGKFHELSLERELQTINVNVIALVRLTHAALVQMVPRKQGKVINISSISGIVPEANMATYGATKAYVTSFGESLHEELRGTGVTVTTVHPGYTRTEFIGRAGLDEKVKDVPSFMWMSGYEVANRAIKAAEKDVVFHAPGFYTIVCAVFNVMPRWLMRHLMRLKG